MKISFEEYKENLFEILQSQNRTNEFITLIDKLKEKGNSKLEIYNLFLQFHAEVQIDKRTKASEELYDVLTNFMDGFTAWGKNFKILPKEPDL